MKHGITGITWYYWYYTLGITHWYYTLVLHTGITHWVPSVHCRSAVTKVTTEARSSQTPAAPWRGPVALAAVHTHTRVLLDCLQDPLGGEQEVEQAAQAVPAVLPLHHAEELPQHGGRAGAEGGVERRQGALDAAVQRLRVLQGETGRGVRVGT